MKLSRAELTALLDEDQEVVIDDDYDLDCFDYDFDTFEPIPWEPYPLDDDYVYDPYDYFYWDED